MTDYAELVERLRAHGAVFNRDNAAMDGADAIEELVAYVDRLRSLDCDLEMLHSKHGTKVVGLMVERDEAREAVKRLAGALKQTNICWPPVSEALADPIVKRIVEGE